MDQQKLINQQPEPKVNHGYGSMAGSSVSTFEEPPIQEPPAYHNLNYSNYQLPPQHNPDPVVPNVIIINQQVSSAQQIGQPQNVREWSTELCGCCEDVNGCLYCTFCFPCFACTLASMMDEWYLGPFCCYSFLLSMRSKFRGQYGIKGSILKDTMLMGCCTECAAHQMYRELKIIKNI